jgi:hypothetical protein
LEHKLDACFREFSQKPCDAYRKHGWRRYTRLGALTAVVTDELSGAPLRDARSSNVASHPVVDNSPLILDESSDHGLGQRYEYI